MKLTVERSIIEQLLHRAASAAHLVGHLDDYRHPDLIHQLGDHVDTIAHALAELLGDTHALAASDPVAPEVARDAAPTLTSIAGGAP